MKKILFWFLFMSATLTLFGQGANLTVQSMFGEHIDTILKYHLAGEGVEITNGKFNNSPGQVTSPQIGVFNRNGYTAFPFETGLVMTTGNCSVAAGPNTSSSSSSQVGVQSYTDVQIQNAGLATASIGGCASLDFDFLAYADTFAFGYVFGSEEYPEFVCATYNDVFAFFLTGPDPVTGLSTTRNVAVIPNTVSAANPNGIPVSINTINIGATSSSTTGTCYDGTYQQYYVANNSTNGVQYDGMTVALFAEGKIMACETYHMHLGICNIGDDLFDSGVFLEEKSFASDFKTKLMMREEWCLHEDVVFTYSTGGIDQAYILTPSGDTLTEQPFVLHDAAVSDSGKYVLRVHSSLPCVDVWSSDSIVLRVVNTYKPDLGPDQYLCPGVVGVISAGYDGENVSYLWNTGDRSENIDVYMSGEYILDITIKNSATGADCRSSDTVNVYFFDMPAIDFAANVVSGCTPLTVRLNNTSAAADNSQFEWVIFDQNNNVVNYSTEKNPVVTFENSGSYSVKLIAISPDGCRDSIVRWNYISASLQPQIEFAASPEVSMMSETSGEVQFTAFMPDEIVGMAGNLLVWDFGDGNSVANELSTSHTYTSWGDYVVTLSLTSGEGCADSVSHVVVIEDDLIFPNVITPNGDGTNDVWAIGNLNTNIDADDPDKYRTNDLRISDRWGKVVFHAKNYDTYSRDGQIFAGTNPFDGNGLPDGVYYYTFTYKGKAKETKYHGSLTIIR